MRTCRRRTFRLLLLPAAGVVFLTVLTAQGGSRRGLKGTSVGRLRTIGHSSKLRDFSRFSYGLGSLSRPTPASSGNLLRRHLSRSTSWFSRHRKRKSGPTGMRDPAPQRRRTKVLYRPKHKDVASYYKGRPGHVKPPTFDASAAGSAHAYLDALARDADDVLSASAKTITSLVPTEPGPYRDYMRKAELAFRDADYVTAFNQYKLANDLAGADPESFLGLTHSSFAMARGSYVRAAYYLGRALRYLPELPLVPLEPKGFWRDQAAYDQQLARLDAHLKKAPADAEARLMKAYLLWFSDDADGTRQSLAAALAAAKDPALIEAIETFRDGMEADREGEPTTRPDPGRSKTAPRPADG